MTRDADEIPESLASNWPLPSPRAYAEVIGQLLALAASAEQETRRQYVLLAGLYENVAWHSAKVAKAPPLPIILPVDMAAGDGASRGRPP